MKKKILIVGNNDGLPGVKVDIESYKRFFKSLYGGSWLDTEIIEKLNVPKSQLVTELQNLKALYLDYLIVIFSGHGGQERETLLELNASGETIGESQLKNIAYRQLNIFDCCRAYPQTIAESVRNEMSTKLSSAKPSTRERFEKRIMEANYQQVSLYACSIGECAHDTAKGGAYSKNLIDCSMIIPGDYKLVGTAHQEAADLTTMAFKDQHPEADLTRLLSSQQLIISIKP